MSKCVVCGAPVPWMDMSEPFVVCAVPECQRVAVAAIRDGRAGIRGSALRSPNMDTDNIWTLPRRLRAMWTP